MTEYRQFRKGEKVTDRYGEKLTVTEQLGCCVWVAEKPGWYHPANLFPVEKVAK
ncbi:hypothetical protein [Ensifer sp. LCM 4579]|uniref:hypothetical protein n=1 Tax=Ensifer sp. LCM 4579 TaxID=1848292 RepID=UPI00155E04A9|nr:hypothetical protein [Ensifer sp. LCM 4579]